MSETTAGRVYPELTWVALIVGWIIGVIIAVSIGYAALILAFSIEGSELAAILGFGVLRGILRRRSIIENNIVQTIASGERYINRVWSASADGYDHEARTYLAKAANQFQDAQQQLMAAAQGAA